MFEGVKLILVKRGKGMRIEVIKENEQKSSVSPNLEAIFSECGSILSDSIPHLQKTVYL